LIFPTPETASRTKQNSGFGRLHIPSIARQEERLSPMFDRLQETFEARRVDIQQSTAGIDPEQILVIETIGNVNDFANAVKLINGLEWMGELETDEIIPDPDFYDEKNPDKQLNGRLYLVLTNQRALIEMLSLWRHYIANPNMEFERGLTKFRDLFLHLKTIRQWDVQDRLHDTGVMNIWLEELKYDGKRVIPFEIELWFRGSENLRALSMNLVSDLIRQLGGQILSQSIIESISYHGLLAELPVNAIRNIVNNPSTQLVKCENVMFFRPVGQMVVGNNSPEGEFEISPIANMPLPTGDPTIALFDGIPLTNHRLLTGRLIVDDPENWDAEYQATERIHGTSMASLIIHGDLTQPQQPLSKPVYVRPIMKPIDWIDYPRPEGIPSSCLAIDLIHNAVKRLFEGAPGIEPVGSKIKVINLSIGDPTRQFTQSMSPIARLLDWLSEKYQVLFIVSAGNHTDQIDLGLTRNEFQTLNDNEIEAAIVKALYKDARNRKILSPAETINGISVGALHIDESVVAYKGDRVDPFTNKLPSPVSAFGSGYRRAIKPDIVYFGGRQLYRIPLTTTTPFTISPVISRITPGNKVAAPGNLPGELNATIYSCGTSNATALITRAASIIYDSVKLIFSDQNIDIEAYGSEIPLIKAMLVHGCSWGEIGSRIADILRTSENNRQIDSLISRWIGYGLPELSRVMDCSEQRATILGFGQLANDQAHIFKLPLPPSLASRSNWRRLTVTLAWLSPISARTQKYRTAGLWFELNNNTLTPTRTDADWRAVKRGTIQHEVFEGESADPFIDGDFIEIKINCREDAGKILKPVAYGLAVSLEVAEGEDISVYNELKTRIIPAIQIQQIITPSGS
jgi:hypothetical protein